MPLPVRIDIQSIGGYGKLWWWDVTYEDSVHNRSGQAETLHEAMVQVEKVIKEGVSK